MNSGSISTRHLRYIIKSVKKANKRGYKMQGATASFPGEHFDVPFPCPPTLLFGIFLREHQKPPPQFLLSFSSPFASNPTHVKYSFRFTRAQGAERRGDPRCCSCSVTAVTATARAAPCHAQAGEGDASEGEGSRRARSWSKRLAMLREPRFRRPPRAPPPRGHHVVYVVCGRRIANQVSRVYRHDDAPANRF